MNWSENTPRTGPEETQIEASFRDAIRIAKEQKSVSLEKRTEGTCAEYHRKKRTPQEDVDSDSLFDNSSNSSPSFIVHQLNRELFRSFSRALSENFNGACFARDDPLGLADPIEVKSHDK